MRGQPPAAKRKLSRARRRVRRRIRSIPGRRRPPHRPHRRRPTVPPRSPSPRPDPQTTLRPPPHTPRHAGSSQPQNRHHRVARPAHDRARCRLGPRTPAAPDPGPWPRSQAPQNRRPAPRKRRPRRSRRLPLCLRAPELAAPGSALRPAHPAAPPVVALGCPLWGGIRGAPTPAAAPPATSVNGTGRREDRATLGPRQRRRGQPKSIAAVPGARGARWTRPPPAADA
mmetsp:Transcript_25815/g.83375  ORF Transcript_25815/g.83375 Transcript_25815/m.83375 type:complete len:227 (-) Transcript_25815:91-771(-)